MHVKIPDTVILNEDETVYWQYSNNAQFSNQGKDNFATEVSNSSETSRAINFSYFLPGETMYIRARVYNPNFDNGSSYTYSDEKYSAYTAPITYQVPSLQIGSVITRVTANSVVVSASLKNGGATGYQFAKKSGSKWVTLGQQTSPTFTDEGLVKDKTYEYRVRAYFYNSKTNKTVWSDWYQTKATTWGANLNVKAAAASATSVKLTWKPVTGAEGYEIYRRDTNSYTLNSDKGIGTESFTSDMLVKTLKGAKKKTYTDKKLAKGASYYYEVRAYKTIGKQKYYISEAVGISLKAEGLSGMTTYQKADGKVVATWNKMTGIKGYYVEKYDRATGEYTTVKKLKASATSYTFAKVNIGSDSITYRIRPYSAKYVYDGSSVTVYPTLAAVTGVKAVKKDNGVQVSWKPVAGADYYRVYRTTDSDYIYNKTTKTYSYYGGQTVYEGAVNTTGCKPELSTESSEGYKWNGTYATSKITGTSVLDTALTYQKRSVDENGKYVQIGQMTDGTIIYQTEEAFYNGIEGPEPGATYYYYVVAYAYTTNGLTDYDTVSSGASKASEVTFTNANAKKVSKITTATSKKKGQAIIKYKKVKGVDGYAVFRSTKKNGTYTLVGTSKKTTFTDITAESGKTYFYKVASYVEGEAKANIYSAKTAAKKVKIK